MGGSEGSSTGGMGDDGTTKDEAIGRGEGRLGCGRDFLFRVTGLQVGGLLVTCDWW